MDSTLYCLSQVPTAAQQVTTVCGYDLTAVLPVHPQITLLAFAMMRFMGWEAKWERKLAALAARREEFQVSEPPTKGLGLTVRPLGVAVSHSAAGISLPHCHMKTSIPCIGTSVPGGL